MSGYKGGHILRIKVKNFMTYDEIELFPKHGLNLVIGLNGSGKSSIMCAICLGLAGKPQYTGRSGQLSDFIKYGCDKATVEIELDDPNSKRGNIVITRIIQGDKSTWLLNKSSVSHHEIQNTVKKFNIDVGNLCQFLPQEKVTEFSKMDKKQRLDNMLQAIGEPWLYSHYKELKQMKVDALKIEEEIRQHESHKSAECRINSRLKIDMEKHEEKMRMKEKLVSLKQQKLKLEYRELREELIKLKGEKKPLKEEENKLTNIITKIDEEIAEKSRFANRVAEEMEELKVKLDEYQNNIARKASELESLHEQSDHAKIHYHNRIEEKKNQKIRLVELERQIKAILELHKQNSVLKPGIEEKDRNVIIELEKIKTAISALGPDQSYAFLERNRLDYSIKETLSEIEKMKNQENKKLEILQHRFRDAYLAVSWLNQNKEKFRAPIHPPMLLLLKVSKDENRKFVENVVSKRDLIAFLCEDKEDNKLLTRILRQEKKLQVNIVMAPDNPIEFYKSPTITPELRSLGVQCFLKDIIDAPDAVMRFLCQCFRIHTIPLCVSQAEQNMNVILEKFSLFFTPDARFHGKLSKYSQNRIVRRDPIRSNNLLPSCKDHSDTLVSLEKKYQNEKEEMNLLNNKLKKIQDEMKEYERKENTLREEKRKLHEKLQEINNIEKQYVLKAQSYERKRKELIDEEAEKVKVAQLMKQINNTKLIKCGEISRYLQEFIPLKIEKLECYLKLRFVTQKSLIHLKNLITEKVAEHQAIHNKLIEISESMNELTTKGKAMFEEIKKFLTEEKMTPEQQLMYNNLSCMSKENVEMEIRHIEATLELNSEENAEAAREYKERKARIELTEKEIENLKSKLKQMQRKMMEKKKEWLPALRIHIRNINSKFSKYYRQLNCTGEISLDDCNDTDDFPKYGLQITLKYRDNEPLMELSNTHHSGGECSVAAIIFILSLQELTEVPFRCIDEINQGMDAQNERSIYNLIADSAKNGSCSQYFLLTPKLLMDLEMIENRDVAVHIIFNSLFLDMKLDVQRHIELAG